MNGNEEFGNGLEEDIIEAQAIEEVDVEERENSESEWNRRRQMLRDRYKNIVKTIANDIVDYNTHNEIIAQEVERRAKEVAEWARKEKLLGGLPTKEILDKVYRRLRDGKSLVRAIDGLCSITTWRKWREEIDVVRAVEEQAKAERANILMEEAQDIADQADRTRIGEVSRDKLMIETRLRELDRIDKITEMRLSKNLPSNASFVPIQINVGYADKKSTTLKFEPNK